MQRKLYSSLDAVEDAVLFPEEHPQLRLLLRQHTYVVLDASADELEAQEDNPESVLSLLLRIEGNAFTYHALQDWQRTPEHLVASEAAGALFVLDQDEEECEQLSRRFGVCAVNRRAVQAADYLLRPLARKELVTTTAYQATVNERLRKGWFAALTVPELLLSRAPLNALVIIDTYLFGDKGRFVGQGKENLIGLLQALLPASLDIEFHLLLVAANAQVPFNEQTFSTFRAEVETALERPYPIRIGLVTRPPGGKDRRSITGNYYFCTSQHGFTCFSEATPSYNNDFIVNGAFQGADLPGFDLPVRSMSTELKTAKRLLHDNRTRQSAPGAYVDSSRTYLGFCDNRLLALVP